MSQKGDTLPLTRSRSRSSDHNERLEPRLLRAAESDDVELLQQIITAAKVKNQLNENFLRIGLMRSAEKGKIKATEFLLRQGALPDDAPGNRLPPLLRAVERNNIEIVQLLLRYEANPNVMDKKKRSALMTAAWYGHYHILSLLLGKGADAKAKDHNGRNVLHNLAADKKCAWGNSIIELLLSHNIPLDGEEAQDKLHRTPLLWACATGKLPLAEQFLTRPKGPKASILATDGRGKTALHLAIAHDRDDMVEMLLKYHADVMAKSDGGWTALHTAMEIGSVKIARILLEKGAEVNAHLLNGMMPIHIAAQNGHIECVRLLLAQPGIKRAHRDAFGFTPFLRAAQNKRKDIVHLLAPVNLVDKLSEDALGACNGFNATIVDFGNFRNENKVTRPTVFELLYGRDEVNERKPKLTILPNDKATVFRWIHLPANNMAWVEVLLTKLFIEENASDVEGFKMLERSFSHQHRGQQSHSHFMRPLCQSTPRAPKERVEEEEAPEPPPPADRGPPTIVINGGGNPSRSSTFREDSSDFFKSSPQQSSKENVKPKDKGKKPQKGNKSPKIDTPTRDRQYHPKAPENPRPRSPASPGHKLVAPSKGNIFTFMPYLHFESTARRQEMEQAIKRAETLRHPHGPRLDRAQTYDEMLIRAHLATSTVSLHVRRTLDQSFYHNIDTSSRDQDQVVYRYQLRESSANNSPAVPSPTCDPKIVMVDQLWLWILGPNLVLTAFPQRWQQPKNDPLNVLDAIIEDINSKTREPVHSVYDLAVIITNRCTGVFNQHRMGDENYQFLDMFESSIGSATDRETVLFKEFNAASAQASAWLQHHRRPNRFSRYLSEGVDSETEFKFDSSIHGPLFVDKLLDIGEETDLLAETKDIRDELNMIAKVLSDQLAVLPDLQECICEIYRESQKSQQEVKKRFKDQYKTIETHINDISRMDRQAERIYKSITDMLDLKQKHANAFEARFARDQAAGTARQSQTIMVFTIVTIIFLPLSFIATFFAINISDFPHGANGPALPLSYVTKYIFGIGFAVSIPLIAVALLQDDIRDLVGSLRNAWARWKMSKNEAAASTGLQMIKIQQAISVAKSARMSVDNEWIREGVGRVSFQGAGAREEKVQTGFRMRGSQDLERGAGTVGRR